jgi:ABC-type multidrug transport system fused ATPase/permease subunit
MKRINKIFILFNSAEKRNFFLLLFLFFLSAFIETFGIVSILPFINILINPELIISNKYLNLIFQKSNIIGINSYQEFTFLFGVIVLLFLIFSLSLKAAVSHMQIVFIYNQEHAISSRLVESYLSQPYNWFLSQNSPELVKNILSDIYSIVVHFIYPVLNLIMYGILLTILICLLFLINPYVTIIFGIVLVGAYLSIFFWSRNLNKKWGLKVSNMNQERYTIVSEALHAFKEVKSAGLEKNYINNYKKVSEIYSTNLSFSQSIASIPRFFLEMLIFGGAITYILISIKILKNDFINIIPTFVIFVFASYRIIPAIQHIYSAISQISFSEVILDRIIKDLSLLKSNFISSRTKVLKLTKSIKLNNVSFYYPNAKYKVIKNINLNLPAFKKIAIIGPTGSGKTTILDIILGLLDPSEGNLSVDDNIININNRSAWQKNIGYVPQQVYLSDKSIRSNIAFGLDENDISQEKVEMAAKFANLHDFILKELPMQYETKIGERGVRISGGQRQRIGIARAIYHKPQLIIFDEATNALDSNAEKSIIDSINNLKDDFTIIIITHNLKVAKYCDIIFSIELGKLKVL